MDAQKDLARAETMTMEQWDRLVDKEARMYPNQYVFHSFYQESLSSFQKTRTVQVSTQDMPALKVREKWVSWWQKESPQRGRVI